MNSESGVGAIESAPRPRALFPRAILEIARFGSSDRSLTLEDTLSTNLVRDARALRLIQLGARVSLATKLTGVPRATAKSWYQQIHGRPSPPGLAPFTDAWYVKSELRMLHTNIAWKIWCSARRCSDEAQTLIILAEAYRDVIHKPLLDLTHLYFMPRLLVLKLWCEDDCSKCHARWIRRVDEIHLDCPACRIQALYRCKRCNSPLEQKRAGRRATLCNKCRK